MPAAADAPFRIVIAGAGVAGLEALLALRRLIGPGPEITVLAPEDHFVDRPAWVREPFGFGAAPRLDLRAVAESQGARLHRGHLAAVDAPRRRVRTGGGDELPYDALLVATGARAGAGLRGAATFGAGRGAEPLTVVIGELERGEVRRIVFAVTAAEGWTLPLYELALMTATHVRAQGLEGEVSVVTPERAPLEVFGPPAGSAVRRLLAERGVDLHTDAAPAVAEKGRLVTRGGLSPDADRVVALARPEPRPVAGLLSDQAGWLPVDRHGHVAGHEGVFAAGDGTAFPVKQGGLAA
ncbi:MAG TPA: FAD-dependent oxidoreductase, partial [Solirubrobacteraceae bacterium]|nr:FAD-dependent oxidoreductase [Solirubrobacteraceae bacterium]